MIRLSPKRVILSLVLAPLALAALVFVSLGIAQSRTVSIPAGTYRSLSYSSLELPQSDRWTFLVRPEGTSPWAAGKWVGRAQPETRYQLQRKPISRAVFESALESDAGGVVDVVVDREGELATLNLPPQPTGGFGPH